MGNLIIDLDASIDGTKVNNMNQNGKSNVNLSNSTDIGVKLSDKGGQVGPTGSTVSAKDSKNDSIWNQNQNNKHNKAKSNNNEDESKKSSKSEIDPSKSKSNQNGSSPSDSASVGGVGGNSNIIKLADVKSKNKIGGVSGGKANTTGQSNGPSSNPRAAPLSQSHPASAQQQRETKQNTQTAQNNAQPNHLTTALKTAKKQTIFHKEKSDHADIGITTAGKSGGTNNTKEKTLESNAAVEHKQNSKTASAGNLANSKQGRRESQDDATAQQKSKQEVSHHMSHISPFYISRFNMVVRNTHTFINVCSMSHTLSEHDNNGLSLHFWVTVILQSLVIFFTFVT